MANSQQNIIVGVVIDREFDNLLTEDGFRIITEDGLSFLALESGGGLTAHSSELFGVSDSRITASLLGGVILKTGVENSQQEVLLVDSKQSLKTGGPNSAQSIKVAR